MAGELFAAGPPVDALRCVRCGARLSPDRACWIDVPCAGQGNAVVHVPACPACAPRRRRARARTG